MKSQEPGLLYHLRENLNSESTWSHGLGIQMKYLKRSIGANFSHVTVWPIAVLLQVSELPYVMFLSCWAFKLLISNSCGDPVIYRSCSHQITEPDIPVAGTLGGKRDWNSFNQPLYLLIVFPTPRTSVERGEVGLYFVIFFIFIVREKQTPIT